MKNDEWERALEMEKNNKKVCETCLGNGGITVENFNDPESFECPDCKGTGEVNEVSELIPEGHEVI